MACAATSWAKRVLLVGASACALQCSAGPQHPRAHHAGAETGPFCDESGPVALPWGVAVTASTTLGANKLEPSCVRARAKECLYRLEVPVRADVRIALLTLAFDGSLSLRRESEPRELACVDDTPLGDTHHARLELTLEPGRYILAVDGSDGAAGPFELFAELDPLPDPEQLCRAAEPLLEGGYTRGSTRAGASAFAPSCAGSHSVADHVYALSLRAPSRVRIREQSEFDAVLALRRECTASARELACNDQNPDGTAQLTAELSRGDYYVVIDGYTPRDSGDYVLAYERSPIPPPSTLAARCTEAPALSVATPQRELDTFYAPSSTAGSCGGDGAPEQLFKLSLAQRQHVTVALSHRELSAVVYLRSSCETDTSELVCTLIPPTERAHIEGARQTVLSLDLNAGDYTLVVDGQEPSDMGAATLHVAFGAPLSEAPAAP